MGKVKICPNCKEEIEEQFDTCWNCQYSFTGEKEGETGNESIATPPAISLNCMRCNVPMEYQGVFKFHEGTRMGALGNLAELFVNRESFDIYLCPNCGKTEFFSANVGRDIRNIEE